MHYEPCIEVRNLSFSYPDGTEALRNISLEIGKGEKVAIVGPNGSGKSTLLLHFNGILRGKGEVRILGKVINKDSLKKIRREVGLVFQEPDDQLFSPTVFDDVAFGPLNQSLPAEEVRKRVREALQKVGMAGYENRSSHHLSYGEKKRVSIATVLSYNPEILALDEPTSNTDPKNRRRLINLLKGIAKTIVIATHDLDLVLDVCPRCMIINQGAIRANGKTQELLTNPHLLEANDLELPLSLSRLSKIKNR